MNNIDKQYQKLLQDIIDNGVKKEDRTGTGTISVFGRQIRHKMSDGFPLLTTKKMAWKTIVTELLWFLRGDTNIKYLVDNGCHIWDGDAYKNYLKHTITGVENGLDRIKGYLDNCLVEFEGSYEHFTNPSFSYGLRPYTQEEFINKIKTDNEFAKKWGELGPIYGKQWRSWAVPRMEPKGFDFDAAWKKHSEIWSANYGEECGPSFGSFCDSILINKNIGIAYGYHTEIDQIANLINDLKTNPDSRRLMVNAWNVGELDQMVLPPCHYGFQVYTRELSLEERAKWLQDNKGYDLLVGNLEHDHIREVVENESPTRAISLMWNQRSVDTFLGLPFNIASYGLLLHIIANEVNMVPDELIGNLGDTHLYSNHIEQAKEQIGRTLTFNERYALFTGHDKTWEEEGGNSYGKINGLDMMDDAGIPTRTRQPFELPKLEILDSKVDNISHYEINDFVLKNYQSHPAIKAPLSN
jgi:thymidylate synthase